MCKYLVADQQSYSAVDLLANAIKVFLHFTVFKTQNGDAEFRKFFGALLIFAKSIIITMIRTVKLHCKRGLFAIEVHYVIANIFLAVKLYRIGFQEIIP